MLYYKVRRSSKTCLFPGLHVPSFPKHERLPMSFAQFLALVTFFNNHPNRLDRDQDGFSVRQGDCDDANNTIHPGAVEIETDWIDQDCDGLTPYNTTPTLYTWFDSDPGVIEALPGDDRAYFGSWSMYADDGSEVEVSMWSLVVVTCENLDYDWPSWTFNPELAQDHLQNCVLVDSDTGSIVAGPVNPDADGYVTFVDEFTVTSIPRTLDLECDLTALVPADTTGFAIHERWGEVSSNSWDVYETFDHDEVHVGWSGWNGTTLDGPDVSVELLTN